MLEKQIESVFATHYDKLLEPGLKFKGRQHILSNRLRLDLVFEDTSGRTVILELKKSAVNREDIGQLLQYAGMVENSRVILAAPIIPSAIKAAFEHYGIEYLEFDLEQIQRLAQESEESSGFEMASAPLIEKVITVPLAKQVIDGNIAFKIVYVDSQWNGVCSKSIYSYNIQNRTWCKEQSDHQESCRSSMYSNPATLNLAHTPCCDAIALKELTFYPGHFQTGNKAGQSIPCINAKLGKLALFTSREPGMPEESRFIFAISQMVQFKTMDFGEGSNFNQAEHFICNRQTAVIFDKAQRPKYWQYYRNKNAPTRISWGTGLVRYIEDSTIERLLADIHVDTRYSYQIREKAAALAQRIYG